MNVTHPLTNARDPDYWAKRTVLITGAGGFAASWICRALAEAGAHIVGIVRDSPGERRLRALGLEEKMSIVRGTIVDTGLVQRALNEYEVDTCIHLAAQAIVGAANRSPISTFESNIQGTWNVLEACRLVSSVKNVVIASSDKAYGEQQELPYTEAMQLQGAFPYDASKVCTDVLARCYAATYELPVAVTRCANIYGGGDLNWSRIVPGTIRSLLHDEAPVIRSDGTPERDYLFVEDVVDAYLLLARTSDRPGIRGTAFNLGSGQPVSALALVELIADVSGKTLKPVVLGHAKGEINRQFLDSSRAHAMLGWHPTRSLTEGLRDTWEWYRTHFTRADD